LDICLGVTDGINSRITEYLKPQPSPQPIEEPGLPRITSPLKEEDILSPVPKRNVTGTALANFVSSTIKAQNSPGDRHRIFKIAEKSAPGNGKLLSPGRVSEKIHPFLIGVLQSPFGWPFRQTFRRRINAIVLGSPHGYEGLIMDAVNAMARLAVFSLKEDQYGNVQRDIARIIRTFTSTITALEDFKGRLDIHWTDVKHKRECPEVDTVLAALKSCLRDILDAFSIYAEELHLTQRELRSAREAAAPSTKPAGDVKGPVGTLTEKEGQKARQVTSSRFREPAVKMRERPRERGLPRAASPLALTSGDGDDAQGGSNGGRRRSRSDSSARDTGDIR
jgi:nucleoporin NDC1